MLAPAARLRVFIVGDQAEHLPLRRAEPQVFRAAQDFIARELQGDRSPRPHPSQRAGRSLP
jgi:hypothetical protein